MSGPRVTGPGPEGAISLDAMAAHREALIAQCPAVPDVPAADAAQLPIHVTRWGATGPRVLIVHGGVQGGLGGGPATFARQEVLGEQGWRIEVVDRPGFGDSPSRGVDDMERDAVWIADMLGDGAHLMGHSWGGAEALLAAGRRPQAVHSLILVEPALAAVVALDPSLQAHPAIQAGNVQRARMLLGARTPADYGVAFARDIAPAGPDGAPNMAVAALQADRALAGRMGCALLQGRMAPPEAFRKAIEAVSQAGVPVLLVTGGWSPAFDAAAEALARLLNGRHVVTTSSTHFVQMEGSEAFNPAVAGFMRDAEQAHGG